MANISPLLAVDDIGRSMDYYERVLKFTKGLTLPVEGADAALATDGGGLMHGEAHLADDIQVMFSPAQGGEGPQAEKLAKGGPRGVGVILYLNLGDTDIDKYYEDVRQAGAKVIESIQDQFWGDRTFTIEDPDSYILTFAKHVRDVDFSQMPPRQG